MGKALTPAQKRAITTLRNSGVAVNLTFGAVVPSPVEAAPRTFKTRAEREAGLGYPCTVAGEDCGRRDLRTPNRASIHGIDAGGHAAKS